MMLFRYGYKLLLVTLYATQLWANAPEAFIRNSLFRFKNNNKLRGLAAAVYYEDKPYFFNLGYAHPAQGIPVTKNTIFDIASISKSFTATLLGLAVIRGEMSLDDPLSAYLPFVRNHPSALSRITLKQLGSHTSSLPREAGLKKRAPNRRHILNSLRSWQPEYPIGSKFKYSNLGFEILGYTLENVFDKPYGRIVQDEIARPLGMTNTFLHIPPPLMPQYAQGFSKKNKPVRRNKLRGYGASGGLHSTTADLMKFLEANMGAHGSQELQDAMKIAQKGYFRANNRMVQGLSWQNFSQDGVELIDKNGGLPGFSSWMGWIPKDRSPNKADVGLILLSNRRTPHLTRFGRKLLAQLAQNYKPSQSKKKS